MIDVSVTVHVRDLVDLRRTFVAPWPSGVAQMADTTRTLFLFATADELRAVAAHFETLAAVVDFDVAAGERDAERTPA